MDKRLNEARCLGSKQKAPTAIRYSYLYSSTVPCRGRCPQSCSFWRERETETETGREMKERESHTDRANSQSKRCNDLLYASKLGMRFRWAGLQGWGFCNYQHQLTTNANDRQELHSGLSIIMTLTNISDMLRVHTEKLYSISLICLMDTHHRYHLKRVSYIASFGATQGPENFQTHYRNVWIQPK